MLASPLTSSRDPPPPLADSITLPREFAYSRYSLDIDSSSSLYFIYLSALPPGLISALYLASSYTPHPLNSQVRARPSTRRSFDELLFAPRIRPSSARCARCTHSRALREREREISVGCKLAFPLYLGRMRRAR